MSFNKLENNGVVDAELLNKVSAALTPSYKRGESINDIYLRNNREYVYVDLEPLRNKMVIDIGDISGISVPESADDFGLFVYNNKAKNINHISSIEIGEMVYQVSPLSKQINNSYSPINTDVFYILVEDAEAYISVLRGEDGRIGIEGSKGKRGPQAPSMSGVGTLIPNLSFQVDQLGNLSDVYDGGVFKSIDHEFVPKVHIACSADIPKDFNRSSTAYIFDNIRASIHRDMGRNFLYFKPDSYKDGFGIKCIHVESGKEDYRMSGSKELIVAGLFRGELTSIYPERYISIAFKFTGNVSGQYTVNIYTPYFDNTHVNLITPSSNEYDTRDNNNYWFKQPDLYTHPDNGKVFTFDHIAGKETKVHFIVDLGEGPGSWMPISMDYDRFDVNLLSSGTKDDAFWYKEVGGWVAISDLDIYPGGHPRVKPLVPFDVDLFNTLCHVEIPDVSYLTFAKSSSRTDRVITSATLMRSQKKSYTGVSLTKYWKKVNGYNTILQKHEDILGVNPANGNTLTPLGDMETDETYTFKNYNELHLKISTNLTVFTKLEYRFQGIGCAFYSNTFGLSSFDAYNNVVIPATHYIATKRAIPN